MFLIDPLTGQAEVGPLPQSEAIDEGFFSKEKAGAFFDGDVYWWVYADGVYMLHSATDPFCLHIFEGIPGSSVPEGIYEVIDVMQMGPGKNKTAGTWEEVLPYIQAYCDNIIQARPHTIFLAPEGEKFSALNLPYVRSN